jgi:hypothetical protein
MGISMLIPEAMISNSTIDKLASGDEKEILTVSDLEHMSLPRVSLTLQSGREGESTLRGA